MKFAIHLLIPILCLTWCTEASASERPAFSSSRLEVQHGGAVGAKTAVGDTTVLIGPWGSGAVVNGQFEDLSGIPAWNGWTSTDMTQRTEEIWHVDTYNVVSGVYSAWCGEMAFESCGAGDPVGGYGNDYNELLTWRLTVADPALPTTLTVSATVNHDVELVYDSCGLGYTKADASIAYLWQADGVGSLVAVHGSVTYLPGEYTGPEGDEVALSWQVRSDQVYSDEDCLYTGSGALQVDDVTVTMEHDGVVTQTFDDFEDGTLGDWVLEIPVGVGDYAHLLWALGDEDPCASNYTPQVLFIADNIMETQSGLPVQWCMDWCYGPGGYIVHTRGGAAGPDYHLHNVIRSPAIAWPAGGYEGMGYEFDVYRHEDLSPDSPGMMYTWGIRSAETLEDLADAGFVSRNFLYYGGPEYARDGDENVSDLLVPGANFVQVELAVQELGYVWGWFGENGTPAPYFDNVRLVAFTVDGPSLAARSIDLAQDAFPADGQLHTEPELGLNDVRFDMARNISPDGHLRNDPGDSIMVSIAPGGAAQLVEQLSGSTVTPPRMNFTIHTNAVFDASLRLPLGPFACGSPGGVQLEGEVTSFSDGLLTGWVDGARMSGYQWAFDLPDEDLLYPGDVMHYYIEAWDVLGGEFRRTTLPADLNGYGDFDTPLAHAEDFVFHALPTVIGSGSQVPVLFWDDNQDPAGQEVWYRAFEEASLRSFKYDVFSTNSSSSGGGNGLGGRATLEQVAGYETIIYTCGDNTAYTITPLDFARDPGDDIGLLHEWLALGSKDLFATGDDLASDVWNSSAAGQELIGLDFGLGVTASDARPLLGGQAAPQAEAVLGSGVFDSGFTWIMYGGCPGLNQFDAVTAGSGARLAEFMDSGSALSAATCASHANGSCVITLPCDLQFVYTAPQTVGVASIQLFEQVMCHFGYCPIGSVEGPTYRFAASAYPNPFNPVTRIDFELPREGRLCLRVYDVRGQLVRTLIDEQRAAGPGHVMWDGGDDEGRAVATGVYFYEVRAAGEAKVEKLLLLK